MKSLSLPALLSLLPLLSFVGSTQAKPQLSEPLKDYQSSTTEVTELKSSVPAMPAETETPHTKAQPKKIKLPTSQAERLNIPLTTPLYDPTDPRHSLHDNCPACGMG